MFKNKIIITAILLAFAGAVRAQQRAHYSQYMYTTQVFNPAYVGTTNNAEVTAIHRAQWVGIEGAPQTSTITVNLPFFKGLGLGTTLMHDVLGPTTETTAQLNLGYRLKINRKTSISLGVTGGGSFMTMDMNQLNMYNPNEVSGTQKLNSTSPVAGAGAYLYSNKFYIGIAAPNIIAGNTGIDAYHRRIQGNLMAGYVFENRNSYSGMKFKPAAMVSYVDGAPLSWGASANFSFQDKFVVGLGYQWKSGISATLGMELAKRWFIGYSYDWNMSPLRSFNYGSHDLLLRVKVGNLNKKHEWTSSRFF